MVTKFLHNKTYYIYNMYKLNIVNLLLIFPINILELFNPMKFWIKNGNIQVFTSYIFYFNLYHIRLNICKSVFLGFYFLLGDIPVILEFKSVIYICPSLSIGLWYDWNICYLRYILFWFKVYCWLYLSIRLPNNQAI